MERPTVASGKNTIISFRNRGHAHDNANKHTKFEYPRWQVRTSQQACTPSHYEKGEKKRVAKSNIGSIRGSILKPISDELVKGKSQVVIFACHVGSNGLDVNGKPTPAGKPGRAMNLFKCWRIELMRTCTRIEAGAPVKISLEMLFGLRMCISAATVRRMKSVPIARHK